jgi:hypothetical protein
MAQVFDRSMNSVARITVFGLPLLFAGSVLGGTILYRSSYITGERDVIDQPVPFSHKHHAGELGIDCRYCHTGVETSSFAGIPPTKTCMNCHQQMWAGSEMLGVVRESYRLDKPIPWERVNNLPDYVYFNHSIHIAKGVGCYSCHGEVDQMSLTFQDHSLLMEWCIKCHRDPESALRPKDEVFSMIWKPEHMTNPATGKPYTQRELGKELKEKHRVRDPLTLTSCSICHR